MPRASARTTTDQAGVALVGALIVVALVAIIAAGVLAQQGQAVHTAGGQRDLAAARWLARGAIDWARNMLAEDGRNTPVDHLGEGWALRIPPLAVLDGGEVAGEIEDHSGRFNLNNLRRDGGIQFPQKAALHRLLEHLGYPAAQAGPLCDALADWLDDDERPVTPHSAESDYYGSQVPPYRAANRPLDDVGDLLRIRGFSPAIVERLRPFVTAVPVPFGLPATAVNVNTAPPEVLAAVLPGLSLDAARLLVAERSRRWFDPRGGDRLDDLRQRLPGGTAPVDGIPLDVRSQWFVVTGRARYGEAVTQMRVLLFRSVLVGAAWPSVVWQRIL